MNKLNDVVLCLLVHIVPIKAKLGQADTGDNEVKLMMKHTLECVCISDPMIKSQAPATSYLWSSPYHTVKYYGIICTCTFTIHVQVVVFTTN